MYVTPRTILANHTLLEPNSEVIAWANMFFGSGWKQKGSTVLVGPAWGSFLPWERRCSKPWASCSAGYLSLCVPVLWFKASLVFLQVYGTELIFTIWELKY